MTLAETHPSLAFEWYATKNFGERPDQISTHSHQRIWWICRTCSYQWISTVKIGKTNVPRDKLRSHHRLGWDTVEVRGPFDGNWCRDTERELIKELTRRGLRFGKISDSTPLNFDGYTEAWTAVSLEVESFEQILRWLGDSEWAEQ